MSIACDTLWNNFASCVAGEWEGVTATFSASGEPLQLPQHIVPSAFREWGVELHDYQSICSCKATGSQAPPTPTTMAAAGGSTGARSMSYKLKRMMPTVGCEADAVAFMEEASSLWQDLDGPGGELPVLENGSYFSGSRLLQPGPTPSKAAALEMCLAAADGRSRTRILHRLGPATAAAPSHSYSLLSIEIHKERWDSPYRNGEVELTQCGGAQPAFATSPKLKAEELHGQWVPSSGAAYKWCAVDPAGGASSAGDGGAAKEVGRLLQVDAGEDSHRPSAAEHDSQTVLLPLGCWTRVDTSGGDGSLSVVCGVHISSEQRLVGSCVYGNAQLQTVSLGVEHRA
ncbi:MAG: hypothetical protein WDW38_009943 [Sanguina aurantia]